MAYTILNQVLGISAISNIDTTQAVPLGTVIEATDATYGSGLFVYLKGVAATVVGDVVSYNGYTGATTRWAGTAISGVPLAIAMSANTATTSFAWYQIGGNAVLNTSGTVAAGDGCYYNALGSVKSAAVAGKQVVSCVAATANGVPAANQAVYTMQTPFAQGAIT